MLSSRVIPLALAFMISTPWALPAQGVARGSRNLPVDHWAYHYIQRLRTRGLLADLNPLVQPYRRGAVAAGLARLDPDTLTGPLAEWVRLLRQEFWREIDRIEGRDVPAWGIPIGAAAVASTGRRLDPLRPVGSEEAWPRTSGGAWVESGPFTAEARLTFEGQLEDDPDGPVDQGRIGRTDNAYLSFGWSFGDFWFGRLKQNWSPIGTTSLMISDVAPAYPQISFELRAGSFALRSLTGELEALPAVTVGGLKRYVSAHRYEYRSRNLVVGVGESTLFATDKGLQLRFLNPLEGTILQSVTRAREAADQGIEETIVNSFVELFGWFGASGFEAHATFLLDDIDTGSRTPAGGDLAPLRYAFRAGVRLAPPVVPLDLELQYQQVSSFAYRTDDADKVGIYAMLDRGLGENFADFDRLTLVASVAPGVPGLIVSPVVQVQRQGEGDFRVPFPTDPAEFIASPALFLGQKETTLRFGLRGRYQPNRFVHVTWDVGTSLIDDLAHVSGASDTRFTGVIEAGFTIDWPLKGRNEP